ncbi:aminotransferase class I/II-fold pyridoxal phosphate-dependent enzyme [Amycolatopsis sp. CB00013]|uniref:aminotransferase class I/II-fold pyridoxal phosphate-dependent enzyme n=1 Tax=Amycolatopsis sp. CB00013 TaxID=1703945 RepID=UPI00093C0BA7|nr:aminotransferase class I/II-fold pyridoxal phosphate-dependent enzyme [Amycolatopsis sp. CB00013]OKK01431.1 dTDP-4-dehydro-6-deoxyglucose aminotransferase [Amycolatopsis sp. CB00013]
MVKKSMFSNPLHVGRPNVGDRDRFLERINGALDRLWLANNGPLVREFEARVAEMAGTGHCVPVANATTGIQIAAKAAGLQPGDEVIVPSFTSPATPHALQWVGLVPVFCDVEATTANADPEHVEQLIGPKTRAIVGVHVFGRPCEIDQLSKLAEWHGIPVLFDAAQAVGCTYKGKPVGGFGSAEIFSFHATKYVNSFEGGAIVTNDERIASQARVMRNLGLDDNRETVACGINGRMTEAAAAMGLTSLEAMEAFMEINRENHESYRDGLAGLPGVKVYEQADEERANHQYVVIEVDAATAGIHRDAVQAALTEHNVLARPYFHPGCHMIDPYRGRPDVHTPLPLPRTEALCERVLSLPTGTAVGPAEIAAVCEIIRDACAGA